jgi:hypothetical protein
MSVLVRVTKNQFGEIANQLPIARRAILGKRGVEMLNIARRLSRYDETNTAEKHMVEGWEIVETNAGIILQNDVPHTVHNEYGTHKMSAAPMARPAHAQVSPLIVQDFQQLESHLK